MASTTETKQKKMLILKSADNDEFEIEESVGVQSETIKNLVEDGFTFVPLPNVYTKALIKIIDYLKKHANKTDSNDEEIKTFDKDFVNTTFDDLFELVSAANYLHISCLMNMLCQTIADRIKDKSPEAVRKIFHINCDYTPEEEAKIRKANAQAFEGQFDESLD
ncbi:hypothetical protein HAX54_039419 [Datura stramonium]|uniref:SKP1-like protein n=1 Tax=Datura stramonium TaxID=4076 RepID=A0ABS8VQH0_DATST|nr:hypothetical protein [Datura stramonium]